MKRQQKIFDNIFVYQQKATFSNFLGGVLLAGGGVLS